MVRTANSDLALFCIVLLLFVPIPVAGNTTASPGSPPVFYEGQVPYTIQLFIPTQRMIHSDQINDLTSGPGGETIIGTSFGLSTYNGTWNTRHLNLNNISEGLIDDYVTAVERDSDGNLWIGYSGGIQIYDGSSFRSIRDQQLLKETRIKDLQRWGDDMWIATGHAGIHRYRDGAWTWYQPMTRRGPGFYEIRSMAPDMSSDTLVIVTEVEGIWTATPPDQPVFTEIASRYGTWGFLAAARSDPAGGGVYLFNQSLVVYFRYGEDFVPVLAGADLAAGTPAINDIAAGPDGRLFIATDDGIYIWKHGAVAGHLSRFEGLGTHPVIRRIFIDAMNRVWFSSPGYVGLYADQAASTIPVEMVTPVPAVTVTTALTAVPVPAPVPIPVTVAPDKPPFFPNDSFLSFLNPVIDPVIRAIDALGSRG